MRKPARSANAVIPFLRLACYLPLLPMLLLIRFDACGQVVEKEYSIEAILKELAEIQNQGPKNVCVLGTRHCSYLHQQVTNFAAQGVGATAENRIFPVTRVDRNMPVSVTSWCGWARCVSSFLYTTGYCLRKSAVILRC